MIIEDFEKPLNTQRAIPKIYKEWDDANSKSKYSTGNCWTASILEKIRGDLFFLATARDSTKSERSLYKKRVSYE